MHTRKIFLLLALISVFAFACSSSRNMDENIDQPTPPEVQQPSQPINTAGDSTTKAPVTTSPATEPDTTAVTEGKAGGVVTTDQPSANPGSPSPGGASETIGGSTDFSITNAVRDKFAKSTLPSASRLNVTTQDGVVTLSGKASSEDEINQIVEMVRKVPGVREVITKIEAAE